MLPVRCFSAALRTRSADRLLTPVGKRLPTMLEREWIEGGTSDWAGEQRQFEQEVQVFAASLDVSSLVDRLGSRS